MKIKYLGTAAYEGIPSLFCTCRVCTKSKKLGGKNIRTRSQAIIDDEILLDYNPDTVIHNQLYNIDWEKIEAILITHSHSDHLYPQDIEMAGKGYTDNHRVLDFYSAKSGYDMILPYVLTTGGMITANLVESGKSFTVANGKYEVLPLRANHSPETTPVIYAVKRGDKKMLYAHDTGMFFDDVLNDLEKFGKLNLISLDCTGALIENGEWKNGHLKLKTCHEQIEILKKLGVVDSDTVIVLNHFSHNGNATYDEMCAAAKKYGYVVSYDGLEIEF